VVRFTWDRTGSWRIEPGRGRPVAARLEKASTLFRSWTLLAWTDPAGRRYYAVLDAAVVGHREYATLRSRLRLEPPECPP
jgi:hypothetical protein